MKRREFITLLGGAAVAWPLAAHAQQGERIRRIGVLINVAESDPVGKARLSAFVQRLKELGWTEGHNVRLDIRWGAGDHEAYRRYATELVALVPDVIVAVTSPIVAALQRATRTVPIVFAGVIDPVGGGFVNSLARPGGNSTGFALFEYTISVKWLELLKEIAPPLEASGGIARRPRNGRSNRPVCRNPGGGTDRDRIERNRPQRCARDREGRCGIRTRLEWRARCHGKWFRVKPPRRYPQRWRPGTNSRRSTTSATSSAQAA
jgi:hypothetical protein